MDIKVIATKGCTHCPNIERELQDLNVGYEVLFVEENPDVVEKFNIRHSPNLVIDNIVVCRGQPSEGELKSLLKLS